jgi:hypothetical protein
VLAARRRPRLAQLYAAVEQAIGHDFRHQGPIRQILDLAAAPGGPTTSARRATAATVTRARSRRICRRATRTRFCMASMVPRRAWIAALVRSVELVLLTLTARGRLGLGVIAGQIGEVGGTEVGVSYPVEVVLRLAQVHGQGFNTWPPSLSRARQSSGRLRMSSGRRPVNPDCAISLNLFRVLLPSFIAFCGLDGTRSVG